MDGGARGSSVSRRSAWLAELEMAIDEAQLLVWQLGLTGTHSAEALDLYCRLEAARDELDQLRPGPVVRVADQFAPDRSQAATEAATKLWSARA